MESPKIGCDLGPCVSKMLAFKKRIAITFLRFKDFPRGQGLRLGPLRSKSAAFCVGVLKPTKLETPQKTFFEIFSFFDFGPGSPGDSCKWQLGSQTEPICFWNYLVPARSVSSGLPNPWIYLTKTFWAF